MVNPTAQAAASTSTLYAGETLQPGEKLISPNGVMSLVMQPDGNLVLYANGDKARWASGTTTASSRLLLQSDGNLVVYGANNVATWELRTAGSGANRLVVQDDGNVVLYTPANAAAWQSGTKYFPDALAAVGTLPSGARLQSPMGSYELLMQPDGNLVLYAPGARVLWQSRTSQSNSRAVLQNDGNLVVYSPNNTALWNAGSSGTGALLRVQDDGNVVLYGAGNRLLWQTATSGSQAATPPNQNGWTRPAVGPFTSGYGMRGGVMHNGVDIAPACGEPIYAASAGTVTRAAPSNGYGNLIVVDHGGGIVTRYAHMYNNGVLVTVGQNVAAGQRIASVGSNGDSTGCHLHFEVQMNGQFTNPETFLRDRGVTLR